ncbi:MAG: hypothetical protein K0U98_13435 [Deltaproteobacteria bacterium]|nr:hypothetical protein [Deltaproteobacteria bacterium]
MADLPLTLDQLREMLMEKLSPSDHRALELLFRGESQQSKPCASSSKFEEARLAKDTALEGDKSLSVEWIRQLRGRANELEKQREKAPELFQELIQHPLERRQVLVLNSQRFKNRVLCDLLLEKSLEACLREPAKAIQLAELAVTVADGLSVESLREPIVNDFKAKALAHLANAYRVSSEVHLAEETLQKAEHYNLLGTGDLLEKGFLKVVKGALRGNQRRFEECFKQLDGALQIYRQCGETELESQTLISRALYTGYADHPAEAIELLKVGLASVDPAKNPRLALAALHNLVLNLNDLGRTEEAEKLLAQSRPLYHEVGDRISLWRLRWLEARLAQERDQLETAEQAYLETREAFVQEGILWEVALVSLDLAALYAQQGRNNEIHCLVNELVPQFKATGLHREALAALVLFQQASERNHVTTELVRSTMTHLRSLRRDR